MLTIYSFPYSLPSYRTRLAASVMGIDVNIEDIDISQGKQNEESYRAINPIGQVPALVDDANGVQVTDSVAILYYLAKSTDNRKWLGEGLKAEALTDTLLALVPNELRDSVEKARLINAFGLVPDTEFPGCEEKAARVLPIVNGYLEGSNWLTGNDPTLADIAVYATLSYADEAKISLDEYTNIGAWKERFETLPGYITPVKM